MATQAGHRPHRRLPLRVVKLGGSVLERPDLRNWWQRCLQRESPADYILVVGGGRWVDRLRHFDTTVRLGESTSHYLAIAWMSVTVRIAAHRLRLPQVWLSPTDSPPSRVPRAGASAPTVLLWDPYEWWPHGLAEELPWNWNVTSDSIAAWLAAKVAADALWLVKSQPAGTASRQAWADASLVDAYFPRAAATLKDVRVLTPTTNAAEPSGGTVGSGGGL